MDSPHSQQQQQSTPSTQLHRMRAQSNLSHHDHHRGAVQKRSSSSSRAISTTQVDRLYQLAIEQQQQQQQQPNPNSIDAGSIPLTSAPSSWLTPQSSPQPHVYSEPITDSFPQWTVPTPPRSDSGLPTVSLDANEVPVTTGISSTCDFSFDQQPTASAEMSSLGFLLPSQYGSGPIEAEPNTYNMDQNYIPPPRMSQPVSTSGAVAYAQTISSSPALYQSRSAPAAHPGVRRHSDLQNPNNLSSSTYGGAYRRISSSYDSVTSGDYSMAPAQTIPSISGLTQSPQPSPHLGSTGSGMMQSFNPNPSRSPNLYDTSNMYNQQYASASASMPPLYGQSLNNYPHPPFVGSSSDAMATTKPLGSDNSSSIRVLNQRPKPQCWEHGCNGRQFSTFSNLLRHQREKSGTASKSYCPKCGAEFTRTTARNGHLAHDKCTKGQSGRGGSEDDK